MTVRELLARVDSRELSEWMAFYSIEPFGPQQEDMRAGTIAASVLNPWRKSGSKALGPDDFFPQLAGPPRQQTPEEMADVMRSMTISHGGKVIESGDNRQPGGPAQREPGGA